MQFAAFIRRFAQLVGTGPILMPGACPVGIVSIEHPKSIVTPPFSRLHLPVSQDELRLTTLAANSDEAVVPHCVANVQVVCICEIRLHLPHGSAGWKSTETRTGRMVQYTVDDILQVALCAPGTIRDVRVNNRGIRTGESIKVNDRSLQSSASTKARDMIGRVIDITTR